MPPVALRVAHALPDEPAGLVPPQLDGLVSLLPDFEAAAAGFRNQRVGPEVQVGTPSGISISYPELTSQFLEVAHRDGWVRPEFSPPTRDVWRLRDDPRALEQATVLDLARLVTAVIRSDYWTPGQLDVAAESGFLTAAPSRCRSTGIPG